MNVLERKKLNFQNYLKYVLKNLLHFLKITIFLGKIEHKNIFGSVLITIKILPYYNLHIQNTIKSVRNYRSECSINEDFDLL